MEEILFEYFCSGISSQNVQVWVEKKTMDFFEKK
jgi:hypothetical protein